MPAFRTVRVWALTGVSLLALSACDDFDIDLRQNGAATSEAVRQASAPRPEADARGVISYPGYQVAVAQNGDTVANVAARIGINADDLAIHNGLLPTTTLRPGEILALPSRVSSAAEPVDISTLAGDAINRAEGTTPVSTDGTITPAGVEPQRHQVKRGETAFSIARLYNVSPTALADWNGLGPDLEVREGQFLLIPVAASTASASSEVTTATLPGETTPIDSPPSAADPLPEETVAETAPEVASPDLAEDRTRAARLALPLQGNIIREYAKGTNEGIDIAAATGAPVSAAASGTVAAITRDTDQVPILVLRHENDLLTVYANIDNIKVAKGDSVARGQSIATLRAGDPAFLHFEVREGFDSVDPLPYLN